MQDIDPKNGEVFTDEDSAIKDPRSYDASTYTVWSSRVGKVEENGRTYHAYKDGKYMLPNDETEMNRLDIQHKMWCITLDDKLYLAPLNKSTHRVLDLATGTGIWAVEFAKAYPSAEVLGTDLSLVEPLCVPPNCRFEVDDVEDDWTFPFQFDYIHGRCLASCFKDGPSVVDKAYNALAPGGYFELQDFQLHQADNITQGTALHKWLDCMHQAAAKAGRPWKDKTKNYKKWLLERGFDNVKEETFRWPSNQIWPDSEKEKTLGNWWQLQIDYSVLEAGSTRLFTTYLGWSVEELAAFMALLKKDFRDPNMHIYAPIHVVYGRKPS
ncbi:hypothetical protein BP6252_05970 [Coleophoma cylindrospora]|uniref:S-adenosyl-L-methionine-dependent methyltransferase n=1 Tax=Coleophoma cylindrospora TaxID=1849047 RepID=A0A3D8RLJ0_9HELO|nr:hypothetical protein BP6252_05970 [Coleophoma cylindrospora]